MKNARARRLPRRCRIGRATAAAVFAMFVAPAMQAMADVPPFELTWDAPPSCPDAETFRQTIVRNLGPLFDVPRQVTVEAHARAAATGSGYELMLRVTRGSDTGERLLQGPTCEQLVDAAAVVVAIAVDPRADPSQEAARDESLLPEPPPSAMAAGPTARSPNAQPPPEIDRPQPPSVSTSSAPIRTRSRRPRGALRLGGGIGLGILPTPTGAALVGFGLLFRYVRVELDVNSWFWREVESAANPDVGVRLQLWSIRPRVCPRYPFGTLAVHGCIGIHAGAMHAEGTTGLVRRARAHAAWVAASLAPVLSWHLHQNVALLIELEGIAGFTRPAFETEPSGVAYEAGVFGGRALGGLEASWP